MNILTQDLKKLQGATNYYSWIFREIRPFLSNNVCEIGAGTGTFSRYLYKNSPDTLLLCEGCENYFLQLLKKFSSNENVKVFQISIPDDLETLSGLFNKHCISSVVLINVLEHIDADKFFLEEIKKMLPKHGRIIIFSPAHRFLFSKLDVIYGHFRRYSKKEIFRLAHLADLDVTTFRYFNFFGGVAWFLLHRICQLQSLSHSSIKIFEFVVPTFSYIENYVSPPFGLSFIAILTKK